MFNVPSFSYCEAMSERLLFVLRVELMSINIYYLLLSTSYCYTTASLHLLLAFPLELL